MEHNRKLFGDVIPQRAIRAAVFYDGESNIFSSSTEALLEGDIADGEYLNFDTGVAHFVKLKFGIDDFVLRFDAKQPKSEVVLCSNRDKSKYAAYGFTVYFGGGRLIYAMGDGINEHVWEYEVLQEEYCAQIRLHKRTNELDVSINGEPCKPIRSAERLQQGYFTLDALDFYVGADGKGVKSASGEVRNFFLLRG